jgi:Tol biopolymer transport system component
MPADGGEAIQLTGEGGYAPLESPDGKFLYYTKQLWRTNLWKLPVGGGQTTKVLEGLSSYLNLAIVDKGIYFIPLPGPALVPSIQFLDLPTNHIKQIASFERPVGSDDFGAGLPISPDGRWILYTNTQADQGAELRLVENFR